MMYGKKASGKAMPKANKMKKQPEPPKGARLKAMPIKTMMSNQDASEAAIITTGGMANTKKKGQLALAKGSYGRLAEMEAKYNAVKQSRKDAANVAKSKPKPYNAKSMKPMAKKSTKKK
jgi:hypothetical protein